MLFFKSPYAIMTKRQKKLEPWRGIANLQRLLQLGQLEKKKEELLS